MEAAITSVDANRSCLRRCSSSLAIALFISPINVSTSQSEPASDSVGMKASLERCRQAGNNDARRTVAALIECNQFPVNDGSQWQSVLESSADLWEFSGEVFPVFRKQVPCLDAPQERYTSKVEAGCWLAQRFTRGELRRVFSAEHTGLLRRDQRETLELRFKAKDAHPWYENLLSATPTLEMGVDIGDLSSVMLCSVPPNQASYLQRTGRAGRRDGNAFTTTLADGASPHDLYFFEDTNEMLQGEVVPPGIFLRAAEVLRRQMFAFCLDEWVGSGIVDTALPDKTKDALDARDSLDKTRFPYTFLDYVLAHDERLLKDFKDLLASDLDDPVSNRLQGFMLGTNESDALRIHLSKVLEELAKERKAHRDRGEQIRKQIKTNKGLPQDEATRNEVDRLERERQKAIELVKEINERELPLPAPRQ